MTNGYAKGYGEGARAKFIQLVLDSGWVLDTSKTTSKSRYNGEQVQDPHAFLKPAAHGGAWEIRFDYVNRESYGSNRYDDRLRMVDIKHRDAEGKAGDTHRRMKRPGKWDPANQLWETTGPGTLRERAERLVEAPDLALWLAAEAQHIKTEAEHAKWKAQRQDREERDQPTPGVAVSQFSDLGSGYMSRHGTEWSRISRNLTSAAQAVADADGKSDIVALVVEAHKALARVVDSLTDEASLEVGEALGSEVLSA